MSFLAYCNLQRHGARYGARVSGGDKNESDMDAVLRLHEFSRGDNCPK